jgi:hypothetical protein
MWMANAKATAHCVSSREGRRWPGLVRAVPRPGIPTFDCLSLEACSSHSPSCSYRSLQPPTTCCRAEPTEPRPPANPRCHARRVSSYFCTLPRVMLVRSYGCVESCVCGYPFVSVRRCMHAYGRVVWVSSRSWRAPTSKTRRIMGTGRILWECVPKNVPL